MSRTVEAQLRLSAVDRTAKAFASVSKRINAVERQTSAFNRAQMALNRTMASVPLAAARYLGPAALAAGGTMAFKTFAQIDRQIRQIGITAGATQGQTEEMMTRLRKTANDLRVPFEQVVDEMDSLISSGKSLDEAYAFLPVVGRAAKASGADFSDMATTADALSTSLGITADQMEGAFDALAFGGKAGKFELKDMAAELPSLTPAFAALGYKGPEALNKLIATLQGVRKETGTSSEAATALSNVFMKMNSDETAKKFKKFGVDSRKAFADAKKDGRDLLDTFVDLAFEATKGDMDKLPQLFTDAQFLQGARALMNQREQIRKWQADMSGAAGTVKADFESTFNDATSAMDRFGSQWDSLVVRIGEGLAGLVVPGMEAVSDRLEFRDAMLAGAKKRGLSAYETQKLMLLGSEQERGLLAYEGGWRVQYSDEGPITKSPELPSHRRDQAPPKPRDKSGFELLPDTAPMPGDRATAQAYDLTEIRYDRFAPPSAQGLAIQERDAYLRDNPMARKIPGGEMFTGGFGSADDLRQAIEQGGQGAGQSIQDAARAVNDAGSEAGATFANMVKGVGQQIGEDIASSLKANIGNLTVNVRTSGGPPVNVDVGRQGQRAGRRRASEMY